MLRIYSASRCKTSNLHPEKCPVSGSSGLRLRWGCLSHKPEPNSAVTPPSKTRIGILGRGVIAGTFTEQSSFSDPSQLSGLNLKTARTVEFSCSSSLMVLWIGSTKASSCLFLAKWSMPNLWWVYQCANILIISLKRYVGKVKNT